MTGAIGTRGRTGLITALSGLLVLLAAGCSTSASTADWLAGTSGSAKAGGSASAQTATARPSPSASLLDGTALNSLLLSAGFMPAGYRLDPSGTRNGGQSLPQDMPQPVPASQVCANLTGTAWILAGGIDAADFAENDYANASRTAEIAQEIDLFQAGDAAKVMSRLWLAFGDCRSFTQQAAGSSAQATLVRARLPGLGDLAIEAVMTTPLFEGGTTLVAIRVGDAIVTCLDSSPGNDEGAGVIPLAEDLALAVQATPGAGGR